MMVEDKKKVRALIKSLKKKQSTVEKQQASLSIFEKVEQSEIFQQSKVVLLYWSMADEVITHDFILKWWTKKTILLPCVEGDHLLIRTFTGMESMREGDLFNILEPIGEIFEALGKIELIVVPGVAFDKHNNRLGRGRGYYDKLLSLASMHKMGVCFNFQMIDCVPVEAHDVSLDSVITT